MIAGDGDDVLLSAVRSGDGLDDANLVETLDIALFDGGVEHQAGDDEDKDGEDFNEAAEDRADAGVVLAFRAEHPLDDGLVRTPIPDAEDRIT